MHLLLTSVGRRSYLVDYFRQTFNPQRLIHVCNSETTPAFEHADGHFIAPLIYDSSYTDALITYCKHHNISYVLSLFDIDLLILSQQQQRFTDAGITLILAPAHSVEKCNDKWATHQLLQQLGIGSPYTVLSLEQAKQAIVQNELQYPLIIKPRWGMASIGVYIADNEAELQVFYDKCNKDIAATHLKYESERTMDAAVLIQQKLQGQEYGIDVVNSLSQQYLGCVAKQKVRMRAGETDLGLTADPQPFAELARSLSAVIAHKGILSVDCFTCEDGLYVTELNCRISGHYPVSHLAGFDYPALLKQDIETNGKQLSAVSYDIGCYVFKELVPVRVKA
ncbi:ATP-grasp domain-containing protein [Rheinheimera maricola]|uniref:ATP-grasp domain-containing protein n=1 Tax=Rheinheimera maricola TaxID=2793282 RepID=A0ABS7X420_9GAMM|nr:ATP-grasp domain-containing protein [Rheinheimera maricola]MBZ9610308.1 ATP-grasp domain-containing protein [Rheinheimera maricola]